MRTCPTLLAVLGCLATSKAVYEGNRLPRMGLDMFGALGLAINPTGLGLNASPHPLLSNETGAYINHLIEEWNSTGLSLAVIRKDNTATGPQHPGWNIEFGSYGFASTNTTSTVDMTPDTLFSIASNSKLFLAISVGLIIHNKTLAEDFKVKHGVELGWKTRMRDLLGEDWKLQDADATKGATISDLLGHRTGLPRHDYMRVWRNGGIREQIQVLRHLRPSAGFRETFQYSNLMYETLAYLPELLLNQTYETYVAENLFEPLNMTSTTFSVSEIDPYSPAASKVRSGRFAPRMALGYIASNRDLTVGRLGSLRPIVPFFSRPGEERTRAGAGGVISTARDLATWNAMLLSDGAHPFKPNVTIVPKPVLDWVTTGRSIIAGVSRYPDTSPMVYGAGQIRYGYRGLDVIEHDGDYPGFKSAVARYPEKGLGVVALSNDGENGGWVMNAAKWAVVDDVVFGEQEGRVRWNERFQDAVKARHDAERERVTPRPQQPDLPSRAFEELGRKKFAHPAYGDIVLCRVPPWLLRDPHSLLDPSESRTPHQPLFPESTRIPFESSVQGWYSEGYSTDYDNPHTNCTQLLSSPSAQHILSSTRLSPPAPWGQAEEPQPETFLASFPHSFASHLRLTHFNGHLFNVSLVWANDDTRMELGLGICRGRELPSQHQRPNAAQDSGAVLTGLDDAFTAEWVHAITVPGTRDEGSLSLEGLALKDGFWGMQGPDSGAPVGVGQQGAEVWFEAVLP